MLTVATTMLTVATSPQASEVFDLKPTSRGPRLFVKFGYGDHSGTIGRARHTRSGVPRPSLPQRLYWQTGDRTRVDDVYAWATGEAGSLTGRARTDFREVSRSGEEPGRTRGHTPLSIPAQRAEGRHRQ